MNLKISLGGDIVHYIGAIGFFKSIDEIEENKRLSGDFEIYCSGFSCIPALLWYYNKNSAYNTLSKMWNELPKIFPNASKNSLKEISKNVFTLVKMQKKLDEEESRKNLTQFFEKWVPNFEITGSEKIKFCSFNLESSQEEILVGNSIDIIAKAINYPIDFSPVKGYTSLSWIFGIPLGDVIIYIDWIKSFKPQRASDYLLLSTFSRTLNIAKDRISKSKYFINIEIDNNSNFAIIANKFYQAGKKITDSIYK